MAYARWGWRGSDVYVFCNVSGYLDCCGCRLGAEGRYRTTDEMIAHLREHEVAGHTVPPETYAELEEDREDNDEFISDYAAEVAASKDKEQNGV